MALHLMCEGCGKTVLGVTETLKPINGKNLCSQCAANPQQVSAFYCPACAMYFPYSAKKGNGWIELALYLLWIIPGVLYSIWRRTGNTSVCPKCNSANLIQASTETHVKCPDCAEPILKEARVCKHCGLRLLPG